MIIFLRNCFLGKICFPKKLFAGTWGGEGVGYPFPKKLLGAKGDICFLKKFCCAGGGDFPWMVLDSFLRSTSTPMGAHLPLFFLNQL